MSELALKLIRQAKKTKAKKLDLGKCGLTELPDELFELVWLEELYLSDEGWLNNFETKGEMRFKSLNKGEGNNIKYFPSKIQQIKHLKTLLANGNYGNNWGLKDLGPLENLENLQQLEVSNTQVSNLRPLGNLENLKVLTVSETQVSDLRPLKNLQSLQALQISQTQVSDISPLKNLQNLQELNVSKTQVSDLSPLKDLQNLQQLYVSDTQVSDLSPLKDLENLQQLYFQDTQVGDLSPLKNLENLQRLVAFNTQVSDLSPLKNLENLQQLYFQGTQVSDLSPLKGLESLQKLDVFSSQISDLSPLKGLENLRELNVSETQVSDLGHLKKLIEKGIPVKWKIYGDGINVKDCPLTNPPVEIVKQGNKAILNYWKQIEDQGGTQTINEAKLIIVGEGGTGKTTLFNKLINPIFDLNQTPTEETQGINIHEGLAIKEGFLANLWDFGGQELQYMTHQFFLTPNAVYVLMMAARGEAPNLAYWFKIISLLGKDKSGDKVSLIIVLNKKKGSTGMPQYQDLLKIYADDFDYQFIEVDLAVNDKRWESLKEAIEQRLVNLPIVKNELPKQWNPIRESLRKAALEKPYIDAGRLDNLCKPFKVKEEADQFLMTEYLHQLGSLLHFQSEEDNLMDLIVLSPEWVVEGVYTVLKNERIKEKLNGKFSARDMIKILCANQYQIGEKEKKYTRIDAQKLIQLMSKNNFDICYKSESGKYVAAQLLPKDRPSRFIWNKSQSVALQFRYQYPIMPKGLMSRLIVRLSDHLEVLEKQEIVWKKGAILRMEFDGSICRVLMREEDGETKTGLRQIVIEVLEDNPPFRNRKYALQRVRQEIESLHKRWFNNISSEQIIPCNCTECKDSDTPHTYELTDLMTLKKGRAYCIVQEEFVPLQQLLEGVYEPDEIQSFARNKRMDQPD